jgi:hypothetical protein
MKYLMLFVVLFAFGFASCDTQQAPTEPQKSPAGIFNKTETFHRDYDLDILNPCCGELIHFSGTVHSKDQEGDAKWIDAFHLSNMKGVGASGTEYNLQLVVKNFFDSDGGNCPYTQYITQRYRATRTSGDGDCGSFTIDITLKWVYDEDCNIDVYINNVTTTCD